MNYALKLVSLFGVLIASATYADDYGDLKIDKVGPIEKVGPIDPVGKSKDQKSNSQSPQQNVVTPSSKTKSTITIQGTGVDPVDFSSRTPAAKESESSGESVEDVLERMSLGGHKKNGGGSPDFNDAETSTEDNGTDDAVKTLFGAQPNYQDLNAAKVLDPIELPERDAPAGMIKVSMPEAPNKDPRKNFPAQAGGNTAGC